jgi:hypothetical protein
MKPFQPSGVIPPLGLLLLAAAVLVGGAVIGVAVSFLSNFVYLILVFPMGMGLAGGALLAAAVRAGKVRSPVAAMVAGVLLALVIYGSLWTTDYLQLRTNEVDSFLAETPTVERAKVEQLFDQFLITETGQSGFLGYVLLQDQAGVSIGRVGSADNNSFNLGSTFSWVYWALELALILWFCITNGRKPAYEPFCEDCNTWFAKPNLAGTLGVSRQKEALGLIESSNFLKLGEEMQQNPAVPNLGFYLAICPQTCANSEAFFAVRLQKRDSRGNVTTKDIARGMISPIQLADLQKGIRNRKELYGQ